MSTFGLMWTSSSPILAAPTLLAGRRARVLGCRGWRRRDDAGTGQRPALLRCKRQFDGRAELAEFYGVHGSPGAAAMVLRRFARP